VSAHDNTAIIILAAGSSSRLGTSKQLLEIEGEPLLNRTINTSVRSTIRNIIVVLGSEEDQHRSIIGKINVDIVVNSDWRNGIGSSIKKGLQYLLGKDSTLHAIIILVCDQPWLTPEHINNLLSAHCQSKKSIVASLYNSSAGVPAMFTNRHFNEILSLPDEQGAKSIIQQHMKEAEQVNFEKGEIDIDTMEDYQRFKNSRIDAK
jgi:molybdenum cofactor cytidylyltransferase